MSRLTVQTPQFLKLAVWCELYLISTNNSSHSLLLSFLLCRNRKGEFILPQALRRNTVHGGGEGAWKECRVWSRCVFSLEVKRQEELDVRPAFSWPMKQLCTCSGSIPHFSVNPLQKHSHIQQEVTVGDFKHTHTHTHNPTRGDCR